MFVPQRFYKIQAIIRSPCSLNVVHDFQIVHVTSNFELFLCRAFFFGKNGSSLGHIKHNVHTILNLM